MRTSADSFIGEASDFSLCIFDECTMPHDEASQRVALPSQSAAQDYADHNHSYNDDPNEYFAFCGMAQRGHPKDEPDQSCESQYQQGPLPRCHSLPQFWYVGGSHRWLQADMVKVVPTVARERITRINQAAPRTVVDTSSSVRHGKSPLMDRLRIANDASIPCRAIRGHRAHPVSLTTYLGERPYTRDSSLARGSYHA